MKIEEIEEIRKRAQSAAESFGGNTDVLFKAGQIKRLADRVAELESAVSDMRMALQDCKWRFARVLDRWGEL